MLLRNMYSVLYSSSLLSVFFSASNKPIQVTKEQNKVKKKCYSSENTRHALYKHNSVSKNNYRLKSSV